ncbi:MAG: response regulator [Desulfobacterota bacterium]|nr:response regulator [Thermodesulfobacteriota bacterium]
MKGKVCIVDHDLANRGFLRECLERDGYEVLVLESGSQVKTLLTQEPLKVFILNIDTPGVREKALLLDLKKLRQVRTLLIVSERGDPFLKEAIDLGVYGFIYKPFDPMEICTMVSHLLK